jgi:hypothetical protein
MLAQRRPALIRQELKMNKPILCIDFDGVVHSYTSGWKGETVIPDPPVKGALAWLYKATEFWDVQIYSSRSKNPDARYEMLSWMRHWSVSEFGPDHIMSYAGTEYPIKFAHEKPSAFLTIDDRAICFDGAWNALDPQKLLEFRPWNKRELGASGQFPRGQLNADDEGELTLGVAFDEKNGIVVINFGKPVAWMGLEPAQAIEMAKTILKQSGVKDIELTF